MNGARKSWALLDLALSVLMLESGVVWAAPADEGRELLDKGRQLHEQFKFQEAEHALSESLKAFERGDVKPGMAAASEQLAIVYYDLGRYPQTVKSLARALTLYKELNKRSEQAQILVRMAQAYDDWGDYSASLGSLAEAFAMGPYLGQKEKGEVLSKMGDLYFRMGDDTEALVQAQQALKVARVGADPQLVGEILLQLGEIHQARGGYPDALKAYEGASTTFHSSDLQQQENEAKRRIGFIFVAQKQIDEAERVFSGLPYSLGLGRAALETKDLQKATEHFHEALREAETQRDPERLFASNTGLGLAYEGLGLATEAERYLKQAVQNLEELRKSLPEGKRLFFLAGETHGFSRLAAYESLLRVLKARGKENEAFNIAEYTRARVLTEAVAGRLRLEVPAEEPRGVKAVPLSGGESVRLSRVLSLVSHRYDINAPALVALLATAIYEDYGDQEEQHAHELSRQYLKEAGYDAAVVETVARKIKGWKDQGLINHLTSRELTVHQGQ